MRSFRELKVWQKSQEPAKAVYAATAGFPKHEMFALTSQMRRASSSVPGNIAEGCGRSGVADFARFPHIAMGSASELEYFLILAHDLDYMDDARYQLLERDVTEVKRMLTSFIQKLAE